MKFNTYIIILVFLIFQIQIFCCCTVNDKEQKNFSSLNMNSAVNIDFDKLVENVSCVSLENLPEAYMTDCWKIIKYKDVFYLYSLSDFAICLFDKDGKFLKRIDGKGKGAVETPCDIFIDELNEQLWIIESRNFIHKYSLKGDFIAKEELSFNAVKLSHLSNNCFLFYDGGFNQESPFCVRLTTPDFKTVKTFVEKKNKQYRSIPVSLFANSENNKEVYSLLPYVDTIYINNKDKSFAPLFHLNLDNRLLTFDLFPKNGFSDKEMHEVIKKKELIYRITGFNYASGLLFMQLHGRDDSFRAIEVHTQTVYKFNSLIDGVKMYSHITTIQGSTTTSLLISIPAIDFFEEYRKKNNQTRYESVTKMLDAQVRINNRILIEIKIKNHL